MVISEIASVFHLHQQERRSERSHEERVRDVHLFQKTYRTSSDSLWSVILISETGACAFICESLSINGLSLYA